MESLNSKEKSKKTWQFIFIFFALAFIPLAIVFYSYYKTPMALSEEEKGLLKNYSNFEQSQSLLLQKLTLIDSNFSLIVNQNGNQDPTRLIQEAVNSNSQIKQQDSTELVKKIAVMVDHHIDHINTIINQRKEIKLASDKNELLQTKASTPPAYPSNQSGDMTPPPSESLNH